MDTKETHWSGIDVAKKSFDVAVVFSGQHFPQTALHEVPTESFARTREGVRQFLVWLDTHLTLRDEETQVVRVVMESTGKYSLELAQWLRECRASLCPAIVNPQRTSYFIKSLGVRNKTDRLEARALAFYGAERRPAPYVPQAPEGAALRELNRYRDFLVDQRVAESNRADDASSLVCVRTVAGRKRHQLDKDIARVEKEMRILISKNPALNHDYALLTGIVGVGPLTAYTILAELGNLRRFERARQLSAFVGLSPRVYRSGTSVHGKTRMSKSGNPRVRKALYMAAMKAMSTPGPLKDTYDHLVRTGKQPKDALGTVMRKMLVLMRAILIAETPYDPNYQRCGKTC